MRYRAKVDDNQAEIVADLRALGCSVQPLHAVGGGVPKMWQRSRYVKTLWAEKEKHGNH